MSVLFGQVHRGLVNANSRLPGQLQLYLIANQPFQHLACQLVFVRQRPALESKLLLHTLQLALQLTVGNGLGVDQGHHKIDLPCPHWGWQRQTLAGLQLQALSLYTYPRYQSQRQSQARWQKTKHHHHSIIVVETAGRAAGFPQQLIARNIVFQGLQRVDAEPRKADEFQLKHDAGGG